MRRGRITVLRCSTALLASIRSSGPPTSGKGGFLTRTRVRVWICTVPQSGFMPALHLKPVLCLLLLTLMSVDVQAQLGSGTGDVRQTVHVVAPTLNRATFHEVPPSGAVSSLEGHTHTPSMRYSCWACRSLSASAGSPVTNPTTSCCSTQSGALLASCRCCLGSASSHACTLTDIGTAFVSVFTHRRIAAPAAFNPRHHHPACNSCKAHPLHSTTVDYIAVVDLFQSACRCRTRGGRDGCGFAALPGSSPPCLTSTWFARCKILVEDPKESPVYILA